MSEESATTCTDCERMRDDMQALASTISFLGSVIRSGEPFTADVGQAIDNAMHRISRASGFDSSQAP